MEDQELVSTGPPMTGKTRFYLPSFGIGCLGSVEQSPLPLQSFLPLVVPQPPLPLQEFRPLQACLSFLPLDAFLPDSEAFLSPPVFCAIALAVVPATNPDRAAPISSARIDFVMCTAPFLVFFTLYEASLDWSLNSSRPPQTHRREKQNNKLTNCLLFNGLQPHFGRRAGRATVMAFGRGRNINTKGPHRAQE